MIMMSPQWKTTNVFWRNYKFIPFPERKKPNISVIKLHCVSNNQKMDFITPINFKIFVSSLLYAESF